jgi:2-keto-4-pentenoate hydratase/2-oxohepta-3-ene-1,7-dioic acid hydratase in catechol pathway
MFLANFWRLPAMFQLFPQDDPADFAWPVFLGHHADHREDELMKLISYRDGEGDTVGVVDGNGVINVGRASNVEGQTLRQILANGALDAARAYAEGRVADSTLDDVTLLPLIPDPEKIICVGLNYASHAAEGGNKLPEFPSLFPRYSNTQVGHGQPMIRPKVSETFDYEGEFAFVIGKTGRHVKKADAYSHVAGYSCYNDGSIREWQRHTTQYLPGKNFVGTGGFGPWLVTTDEIPDPSVLSIQTRLNGDVMQQGTLDDLIFDVPTLVEYISTFTELVPGDVISTGTTSGVGAYRTPPVWMKAGDTIEVEVSQIGVLRNPIIDE